MSHKTCSVPGCRNRELSRFLCVTHYLAAKSAGTLPALGEPHGHLLPGTAAYARWEKVYERFMHLKRTLSISRYYANRTHVNTERIQWFIRSHRKARGI